MNYSELMAKARATNIERDCVDMASGFCTPERAGPLALLETAMLAIKAGIETGDWACVAEAQAMLEELAGEKT